MSRISVPCLTGDEYREAARRKHQQAEDSFQRCDTDGFVSQWASGMMSQHDALLASLADDGGLAEFPALFDLEGHLVPAKLIPTRYGMSWGIFSSTEQALKRGGQIVEWVSFIGYGDHPRATKNLEAKGYREGTVRVKAGVTLAGGGKGLAGAASVYATTVRLDEGFTPDAEIVWDGREESLEADDDHQAQESYYQSLQFTRSELLS